MPFVSRTTGTNFIDIATRAMLGAPLPASDSYLELPHVAVKAPHFSFLRLGGADPALGVEMTSTGEVACYGDDFDEAFLKALIAVGYRFPICRVLLSSGNFESKAELLESTRALHELGVRFHATPGTAEFLAERGIHASIVYWPLMNMQPSAVELIRLRAIDLVINIPKNYLEEELTNDYLIRRAAIDYGIPLITNRQLVQRLAEALSRSALESLKPRSREEYEDRSPSVPNPALQPQGVLPS